jgi:TRAP-type mannitol/chloroaromatic compound transport system substrate-binding protein
VKRKILTVFIGLTLLLTLAFSAIPGCGGGGGGGEVAPPPLPEVEGAIVMRWQHNLAADDPLYFLAEKVADDIKVGTANRLIVELVPTGTICGNMETLDAVSSGKLDMATVYDSQWGEVDPRFYVLGNLPAGMTADESIAWLVDDSYAEKGGGWGLAQELYNAHNCQWFLYSFGAPLMDYMSTKKIESNTDYKGVKVRATGLVAKVLQEPEFGAIVSDQKVEDLYSALEKGEVDAVFYDNPARNQALGLDKVTKYGGFPGMSMQTRTGSIIMNMDKFNTLTDDIKNYMKWAMQTVAIHMYAYQVMNDAQAFHDMKDAGVEMVVQNEDCQVAWEKVSWRLMNDVAKKDANFKKAWDLYKEMIFLLRPYMKLHIPNYEDIPGAVPNYG